ncbi:GNAT family N-acetyltransferase [Psychrobacillus vulpis]|uniref:GNAT family N-acetyltransferase n=1 Tax=Psychrobacillus vulpis TaxID=2325572 RepID=A0A544TN72_9BACI|nr:GNAT family N-acetyltransferase [Psychrobacillus vulpis]TQR18898.1 GNAT family N-acetyltransferase [Psychrobacillus vulpis]
MNLFNIIKNKKAFWLVDQVKIKGNSEEDYKEALTKILMEYKKGEIEYVSLLMEEAFENWLLDNGFRKISVIHEYVKTLDETYHVETNLTFHSLSEGLMTDLEFAEAYDLCRTGTANKNIPQPMEQVMTSLSSELGEAWRSNCYYFLKENELVGVSIPHIENGTKDEGRMFYFGIVPEMRGRGFGLEIHKITLELMKKIQAHYYVGSTDESNEHMISIFVKNGCRLRDKKGIYRIGK